MILKKLPYHLIPVIVLFLFFIFGCDGNDANDDLICSFQEMQERFANTQCIAEELAEGCNNLSCRTVSLVGFGEKDISLGGFNRQCTILDCDTMECELLVESSEFELGLVSELVIDPSDGLPAGVFVLNEKETPFDCVFIAIN